ncbi:AMP-binding protein [Cedecea sp. P7760]|uniref:AMP-binding protein n=1 Tax=Cedecea sp. P7760 TaxID=2726983 RepID=UPI0015A33427|nr:AMP-binding protein [Cedecea sp. P7760]NWC64645.1 acyl-CoA synthetase [Cedecea sp. P7760]
MKQPLSLAGWLTAPRSSSTLIAWLGNQEWTLGHLRHDVARLMQQMAHRPGQRWALCFENSYLFLVALLATLHAGRTPVIPGHCRVALLNEQRSLFDGVLSDKDLAWQGPLCIVRSGQQTAEEAVFFPEVAADAFVELFTSGSTGTPKRVVKSIAHLDREAALLTAHFAERLEGCRIVASVVPQHLYGLTFRIFLPMTLGQALHAAMLYYAEQLAALSHEHRYAFISSPAFLKRLDLQLSPPPVKTILSAGGLLPWQDVAQAAQWLGVLPDEIYGSTETGVLAWRYREHDDVAWLPFPGVKITPESESFRASSPLIAAEEGLLLDDVLHIEEDGRFRLMGRRGRVVKIEEKRISLTEIEQRLLELEGISEAAALPVSRGGRQGIGVLLVLNESARQRWLQRSGKAQEMAWRRSLQPWLEPVAMPRYWRVVDEIPVNNMNKRVYAQLQELFHETS